MGWNALFGCCPWPAGLAVAAGRARTRRRSLLRRTKGPTRWRGPWCGCVSSGSALEGVLHVLGGLLDVAPGLLGLGLALVGLALRLEALVARRGPCGLLDLALGLGGLVLHLVVESHVVLLPIGPSCLVRPLRTPARDRACG